MVNKSWCFAQWALLVIVVLHLAQAVAGYLAEPSFATGPDAPTAVVLGMDYNGWHALAGFLLFAPGMLFVRRKSWAVAYLVLAGVGGMAPGIWALFSEQVVIFNFPNNIRDAIVHLVTGTVMIAIAAIQMRLDGGWRYSLADLLPPVTAGDRSHVS